MNESNQQGNRDDLSQICMLCGLLILFISDKMKFIKQKFLKIWGLYFQNHIQVEILDSKNTKRKCKKQITKYSSSTIAP